MERGTETTLERLNLGSRFYLKNDKKKKVYEVVSREPPKNIRDMHCMVNCLIDGGNPRYPIQIKSTQAVIFLRYKDK